MKNFYLLLVVFVLMATSGFSQNLLLNGGFEAGNDPNQSWRPLNWPQINSAPNAVWVGTVTPTATEEVVAFEGSNCFRIQSHTAGTHGYIYQEINTPVKGNYQFSFYANFALGTKSELKVEVIDKPKDGVVGAWTYLVKDSVSIKPKEWQKFTYDINYNGSATTENKLQIRFTVFVNKNDLDSKIFLDNVQFGVKGSQTSVSLSKVQDNFIASPVKDIIRFNNSLKDVNEVAIYSITGEQVFKSKSISSGGINVSQLKKGIYLISVKSNSKIHNQKFIKY